MNKKSHIDWIVVSCVTALFLIGLVFVASSSYTATEENYHQYLHYFWIQLIYAILGIVASCFIIRAYKKTNEHMKYYAVIYCIVLLILSLCPIIGKEINGSRRWIGIGSYMIQISEVAKYLVIYYVAGYLERRKDEIHTIKGILQLMFVLSIIVFLMTLEPDFGSATVIVFSSMIMMFISRIRIMFFVLISSSILIAMSLVSVLARYRLNRILSFLNPWDHPYDSGYQVIQSLIAFGRGGKYGVGLGRSIQKLSYLPEAHTDFIFAIIAEELGIIGELIIFSLFFTLIFRIFRIGLIAYKMQRYFESYFLYGTGSYIFAQFFINIGTNMGIIPTKGLTLPFISYGGSSILVNTIFLFTILKIYSDLINEQRISDMTNINKY